jgi:RimJ/RimL family protein N-acetyltransferase
VTQPIRIESKRLTLRELDVEDVSSRYKEWLDDPEVHQFLGTRFEAQTIECITEFVGLQRNRCDSFLLGIFIKDTKGHIGNIKLGPINKNHRSSHISYFIGEKTSWGLGYATEAVSCLTSWGFDVLNLERIEAGCHERNFGSLRVLLNCGYEVEGFFRQSNLERDGTRSGGFWLAKLKE